MPLPLRPLVRPVLRSAPLFLLRGLLLPACSSSGARGAAQGATVGAVAGAVGGASTAATLGVNVGRAAGRGAAYGAGSGAVTGGIQGEQQHAREQAREQARAEAERQARQDELMARIGDDAYRGLVALNQRKYPVTLAHAQTAQSSTTADHAPAGRWLEALTLADEGRDEEASQVLEALLPVDPEVEDVAAARARLEHLTGRLAETRAEYGLA